MLAAFTLAGPSWARVEIHYAPVENLEAIDVTTIDDAERSIDMAAYLLTDGRVIEALADAANRGVVVRIYFDRSQYAARRSEALIALLAAPSVDARIKLGGALMHLKAYAIDGAVLRTGSSNFSRSGLSAQDNDLILIDDAPLVAQFERDFAGMWGQGAALR